MAATTTNEKSYQEELTLFSARLKLRRELEKAPWHPTNFLLHPKRSLKMVFGNMDDEGLEWALAHMESGTAGSKDKPNRPPKPPKRGLGLFRTVGN
jgi:hypothetical protein